MTNKCICQKFGLSTSEWRDSLKIEHLYVFYGTLAPVLESCEYGESLCIRRHKDVTSLLTSALREGGYELHEEEHVLSDMAGIKRIVKIAINKSTRKSHILDPNIRLEIMKKSQPNWMKNREEFMNRPVTSTNLNSM